MTTLDDYTRADYWAETGWIAPWLKDVNPAYWPEMMACIGENWVVNKRDRWREFFLTPHGREVLRTQLTGMSKPMCLRAPSNSSSAMRCWSIF